MCYRREIYEDEGNLEDGCGVQRVGGEEHGRAVEMSMSYKMCCVLECMNNKSCT